MELSFEYLMSKDCLKWITISSEQAMLMSVCLQGMVDELLNQKDGTDLNNIQVRHNTLQIFETLQIRFIWTIQLPKTLQPLPTYIRRDGKSRRISESSSTDTISSLVSALQQFKRTQTIEFCYFRLMETFHCSCIVSRCLCVRNCEIKSPQRCCSVAAARNRYTTRLSKVSVMMICSYRGPNLIETKFCAVPYMPEIGAKYRITSQMISSLERTKSHAKLYSRYYKTIF